MEQILSGDNLRLAHRAVIRNKGAPGVDGITVKDITAHIRQHWPLIRHKLYEGHYQPAQLKGVRTRKPNGGERLLGIPTVQDRIIQQAVQRQLSTLFEPTFSDYSYGYRPGRSAHDAIRAAQDYVQAGKSWVLDKGRDLEGDIQRKRYQKIVGKLNETTAKRDLQDLVSKGVLAPTETKGRNAGYRLQNNNPTPRAARRHSWSSSDAEPFFR